MDAERIRAEVDRLPLIEPEHVLEDSDVWEGDENGGHFILSRTAFLIVDFELLELVVTGPVEARASLIRDFRAAFGKPTRIDVFPEEPNGIDMMTWLILPSSSS